MSMLRKILMLLVALVVVSGGILYYYNSQDLYDSSKYNADIVGGGEGGGLLPGT